MTWRLFSVAFVSCVWEVHSMFLEHLHIAEIHSVTYLVETAAYIQRDVTTFAISILIPF